MAKKHVVKLTRDERAQLEQVISKGKAAGWKIRPPQALLKVDQGPEGEGWTATCPKLLDHYIGATSEIRRKRTSICISSISCDGVPPLGGAKTRGRVSVPA